MKTIKPEELQNNPFQLIGKEWMLITAKKNDQINTMTASWGGVGILWNKNVAFIFIRPSRYTKEFVDNADTLSLSFFGNDYRKELGYLGRVSGRDENKIENANLHIAYQDDTPFFKECSMTFLCRKLYNQEFGEQFLLDSSIDSICYPEKDYHTMYIVEIEKILLKEE